MNLDHINLYVRDVVISRQFYEALLPPHGYIVNREFENIAVGFGDKNYAVLALVRHKEPIQATQLAFRVDAREEVDLLYRKAIEAGGTDNGKPGLRPRKTSSGVRLFMLSWYLLVL